MLRPGDIIFVRPGGPSDHVGQLVARATGGPYCHVQIVTAARSRQGVGDTQVVEALASGIVRSVLPYDPAPADVSPVGATLDVEGLAHGVAWLAEQVGRPYGVGDIAADVVRFLLPAVLGGRTPFLVWPRRYDCSDLAARFLLQAGYRWLPDDVAMDPSQVSPNDLARGLEVIK